MVAKKMWNPFKPTAGMNPPELIGRAPVLERFAESIDNGPGAPDRLMRVSGVRGVGKTALLNALGAVAAGSGFKVVNVAGTPGFMERVTAELAPNVSVDSISFAPEVLGFKAGSVGFARSVVTMTAAMRTAAKRGLLVTVDEVQDSDHDEMRAFGNEVQLLVREGANIAFAFAGLPDAVDQVVSGKGLTFLQRASQVNLTCLLDAEVRASLFETFASSGVALGEGFADELATAAAGYPFMVQLVGYHVWQSARRRAADVVTRDDVEHGVDIARQSFDAMVIEPALRRLPEGQVRYLLAMARVGEGPVASGDVAQVLGRDANQVSTYRKRLIDASVIESAGYGNVVFSIPYMRAYLLNHQADLDESLYRAR